MRDVSIFIDVKKIFCCKCLHCVRGLLNNIIEKSQKRNYTIIVLLNNPIRIIKEDKYG